MHNTDIPKSTPKAINIAILPFGVAPSADDASLKLCANAAPTTIPITVMAESAFPSPDRINCLNGQPPNKTEPHPATNIPMKFQVPSLNAIG